MFPKRKPYRSSAYLDYVRAHACCGCLASPPSEAHHFMEGGGGMGTKCDDHFTAPLCRECHACWHTEAVLPVYRPTDRRAQAFNLSRAKSVALLYQNQAMLLATWLRRTNVELMEGAF